MAINVSQNGTQAGSRSTAPGSRTPDPVTELRFKVDISGLTLGYFAECTGLSVEWEPFEIQEGGENRFAYKFRGRTKYPNLVLKRGVTHEDALMAWFFRCQDKCERHTITVSLIGPDTQSVRRWSFADAFPMKWTGPNLNAGSNNVASETLEIAHHGFAPQS